MIIKSRPVTQLPDVERIKDEMTKNFGLEMSEILIEALRNIYDDIVNLEKTERVTSFPTANLEHRGKFVLVEGTSGATDDLYLCVDTGGAGYNWAKVTIT